MYGGYGNIWNQGASQWSGNVPQQQNQSGVPFQGNVGVPVLNAGHGFQNSGAVAQQGNMSAPVGTSYPNMGMQAVNQNMGMQAANQNPGMQALNQNPFMSYPNMGMGYGQNVNPANSWASNSNFQIQQQVFMASKNLLAFPGGRPPLPPGPPPPDKPNEVKVTQNQPSQQPPPPPPQQLPPQQQLLSQQRPPQPHLLPQQQLPPQQHLLAPSIVKAPNVSTMASTFNPEDAYNIIKSAAILGLLPSSGPLAPLTALNVSEELFGSKSNGQGIPGLDMTDNELPSNKPPEPEVIDLDNDQTDKKKGSKKGTEMEKTAPVIPANTTTSGDKSESQKAPLNQSKKEVVWELRPEVKPSELTVPLPQDKTNSDNGHESQKPVNQIPPSQTETSGDADNADAKPDESKVRIPLEPADGKQLVYDRKTLKQFDQKFREWEGQFEKWKKDNGNHPNQNTYKQYLDQWNSWREQLVEQRRSILETMTKARIDSKEVLLSKFESFNEDESSGIDSERLNNEDSDGNLWTRNASENPFETAPKRQGLGESNSAFSMTRQNESLKEKEKSQIQNRLAALAAPGGAERNPRNAAPGPVPFGNKPNSMFENMESSFGNSTGGGMNNTKKFPSAEAESAKVPFEWSLPSPNEKNPFDISPSNNNPFMQQAGPNPFDMSPQQRLPSLQDFINQTNLDFSTPKSNFSTQQVANPFITTDSKSVSSSSLGQESGPPQRILRDPQATSNKPNPKVIISPSSAIRLEANPVGIPLLRAAAEQGNEHQEEEDYSREENFAGEEEDNTANLEYDDEDFENAEVIDYGASNSLDDLDLPRGEKANVENETGDDDFSLDDTEVIDYGGQGALDDPHYPEVPPHGHMYDGPYPPYPYEEGYPPMYPGMMRGRGRGGFIRGRGRGGYFRGPAPYPHPAMGPPMAPPYYGRMPMPPGPDYHAHPHYDSSYPSHHPSWYEHDDREAPVPIPPPVAGSPEVVELSPSPEPAAGPRVKIAPPEFDDDDKGAVKRSSSRDAPRRRSSRERSRSRSRSRSRERRARSDKRSSPDRQRRDRERGRSRSPDSRRRYDDRRSRESRDRYRGRGRRSSSRSRSRSPSRGNSDNLARNPLFPSAGTMPLKQAASANPAASRDQTFLIEDFLNKPGRATRPQRLVIIVRGLPGSGKSHVVKLIKEREVENGGKAPRILSLDNYFTTEVEKKEKDPITGLEVKSTVIEYEYDEEREPLYRAQLIRQFKKTIDDGYFSFVVIDGVNELIRHFEEMATFATQKRFQVYVVEMEDTVDVCVKRNTHKRTKDELLKIQRRWEKTPSKYAKLDIRSLLVQDDVIDDDVEMEDVSDVEPDAIEQPIVPSVLTPAEQGKIGPQVVGVEDIEDDDSGDHLLTSAITSKWDTIEQSQEKLNKLDGLACRKRRSHHEDSEVEKASSIEMWLTSNMPEDYICRGQTIPGQKRVRWADIEARKEQDRMREMGFVMGQDWNRMMDPTFGGSALTKTKFI